MVASHSYSAQLIHYACQCMVLLVVLGRYMAMEQMILVVDDDEPSARLLGRYLESLGQSSQMVTSGAEALETLRDDPAADESLQRPLRPCNAGHEWL